MKETPILFSGPMVRAILRDVDPKTQTRRLVRLPAGTTPSAFGAVLQRAAELGIDGGSVFGRPGDRLWVRETFGINAFPYPDDSDDERIIYAATEERPPGMKWRPSIHMPRWACRLYLRIKSVRVERLNDISEEDARAEGVASVAEFRELWESLNGAGSWSRNPFVWVVSFEVAP